MARQALCTHTHVEQQMNDCHFTNEINLQMERVAQCEQTPELKSESFTSIDPFDFKVPLYQ